MATDDMRLLREFAQAQSEPAFEALVTRHTNLVYSAALRQVGDPGLAQDVTQAVFIILARKAGQLGPKTILSGWLYRTTGYVSGSVLKQQRRRQFREQEAYMESMLNQPDDPIWKQIAPLLDEAMSRLGQADRDALVLRYFEGRSLMEVGSALGANEEAVKKRVSRALGKLRNFFSHRGVDSTTEIIAGTISAHSIQAAPASLAKTISAVAIAKGAAASASTLTLVKGALKVMAWANVKMAIGVGIIVVLAAGTATLTVKEIQQSTTYTFSLTNSQNTVIIYRTKDPELKPYMLRVFAMDKILDSKSPDRMDKFVEAARDLIKDYPTRPNGYQALMEAMTDDYEVFGEPAQARALANELITGPAPDEFKQWAQGFLDRMDDVGNPIAIKFIAMDGREVDLENMKGKVVLVDFWEGGEARQIKALYEKYHSQGLEVIGIYSYTDKAACEKYIEHHHIPWPEYFDGKQMNRFEIQFGIDGIPHDFLVDKKGCLRFDNLYAGQDLEKKVIALLAEN